MVTPRLCRSTPTRAPGRHHGGPSFRARDGCAMPHPSKLVWPCTRPFRTCGHSLERRGGATASSIRYRIMKSTDADNRHFASIAAVGSGVETASCGHQDGRSSSLIASTGSAGQGTDRENRFMPRGITQDQVSAAADAILRTGENPTVEKVRANLGTGSPNTVTRMLDMWRNQLGTWPRELSALTGLPGPVGEAMLALWQLAIAQSSAHVPR